MVVGKGTEAQDRAVRVLGSDERNVEALRFVVFHLPARAGQYQNAQQKLQQLVELISRHEPKTAALFFNVARTVARLAGRAPGSLQRSLRIARPARPTGSARVSAGRVAGRPEAGPKSSTESRIATRLVAGSGTT